MDSSTMATGTSPMPMMMTFFQSSETPLFSTSWIPASPAAYAGTCLFVVALAIAFRGLLAARAWKEAAWRAADRRRRYIAVVGKPRTAERLAQQYAVGRMVLSANGVEEDVVVVESRDEADTQPWRISVDPLRALIDSVIAAVGYLLMLAVMTMNIGYFLSVLAGTFLGSLVFGRYATSFAH